MTVTAAAFLNHILPTEGYKVAVEFHEKRPRQRFFTSTDALAAHISQQDALGKTVYHACSSFKTNESRKAVNALGAKSFWLDVDCGAGKPYADATLGAEAVITFCRATGLPLPVFVGSGFGLHIYWSLRALLEPEIWQAASLRLRALCESHKLEVDRHRTCDLSSVLRTPGTHNRKHGGFEIVRTGELTGPYAFEELGALNETVVVARSTVQLLLLQSGPRDKTRSLVPGLNDAAGNIYAEAPAFAREIVHRCAQIGDLESSGGCLPEPTWYACLGVLAHCADAELAHTWSAGYPGYSADETQGRLERAQGFGPTTCAHFQGINPKGCEGCPHKGTITSPIQLGRSTAQSFTSPQVRISLPDHEANGGGPIHIPQGFEITANQTIFRSEKAGGKTATEVVCGCPIYLNGVQTGEVQDEKHSYEFQCFKPHEGWRPVGIGAKKLFGANGMSEMYDRGITVHNPDLFRKFVREAIDMFHAEEKTQKRYEQYGWKHDDTAFLVGKRLYNGTGISEIIGSDEVRTRAQWLGPARGGSLSAWKGAANQLFATGCEAQSFALLCSFAAPLMKFHEEDEGGAIISLVNKASGTGKTTSLDAVASVWGRSEGIKLTNEDTRISKSIVLGVLGNLPVIWDELHNKDPDIIREFVLSFTGGRDKLRATQEGELRHSKAKWATLLVTAQNLSIVDQLSNNYGTDAPAFRVLEFKVDPPKEFIQGDGLKRTLKANHGYAGDAYLRYIMQPEVLAWMRKALPQWTAELWTRSGLRSEHRFWIRSLGAVAVAASIVHKLELLDFSPQRIVEWALHSIIAAQDYGSGVTGRDTLELDLLSEFLNEHTQNTLVMRGPFLPGKSAPPPLRMPTRELRVRFETDPPRIVIPHAYLRAWLLKKNLSPRDVMNCLRSLQVMKEAKRYLTLGAGTDLPGGQLPCVEIDAKHPALSGVVREVAKLEASA